MFRVALPVLGGLMLALPALGGPIPEASEPEIESAPPWLDECSSPEDGALGEEDVSDDFAAWCNPNAYPVCEYHDGKSCSGGMLLCWVNPLYCEPGICYCWNGRWDCF